jgi:small-conductance mechanosensitive channel
MDRFIQTGVIFGNHIVVWTLAIIVFFSVFMFSVMVRRVITAQLMRIGEASQGVTRAIAALLQSTHWLFIFAVALGLAKQLLALPEPVDRFVSGIALVATLVQVGIWASNMSTALIDRHLRASHKRDPASASAAQIIRVSCLAVVWSAILLMGLSNFGIDITGLVAGLGVGGIAVAFALQSVLKDLFASLAIILDKPFVVGDFIIFDDQLGTVERIGLKTTRVRSLSGEQISVSNDALLTTRLRNFKRMEERRVVFSIVTHFDTPIDKLEEFPQYMRSTIERVERARFDRSHLAEFTEAGPRFEIVYYVLSPDYNIYMDIHQRILIDAARWFDQNGLKFAHPSRRLLFGHEGGRRAAVTAVRSDIGGRQRRDEAARA